MLLDTLVDFAQVLFKKLNEHMSWILWKLEDARLYGKTSNRYETWQASQQQCCWDACQISKQ